MIDVLSLRVNGMGNAWPIPLGEQHPFYREGEQPDYANASFSLLGLNNNGGIEKEILIDAGHGIVPFLLKNGNHIPDAAVITHPHFDHILGLDWIIQSYYRFHGHQPYPVYATQGCRDQILATMPHLNGLTDFRLLSFGESIPVDEMSGLSVTAFPVYHGPHASGAAMILFHWAPGNGRVLFTGDVLVPMIRKEDLNNLSGVDWMISDANNRFPYPRSNHWSVTRNEPADHRFLLPWIETLNKTLISVPHQHTGFGAYAYLLGFFEDFPTPERYQFTVMELIREIMPKHIIFTHYSGLEDQKYYQQPLLNRPELLHWGEALMSDAHTGTTLHVPETGEIISVVHRR